MLMIAATATHHIPDTGCVACFELTIAHDGKLKISFSVACTLCQAGFTTYARL